jgi:hypothetical protein
MGGLERRRARGRSQPPPPLHCRRSPMMRVFVSKPDQQSHRHRQQMRMRQNCIQPFS